jgi:hypothetical protein
VGGGHLAERAQERRSPAQRGRAEERAASTEVAGQRVVRRMVAGQQTSSEGL